MEIRPVAFVRSPFKEKFGAPRQSGRAPHVISEIVFEPEYRAEEAFRGLEGFGYLWVLFGFSLVGEDEVKLCVRPPRLGGNRKVGVFASRSPFRPNRIGLSSVKLEGIRRDPVLGTVLTVSGADIADGTPVYDIKPYLPFTDSHPEAACGYAGEHEDHRLKVCDPAGLLGLLPPELREGAAECIADDPRPSYADDPDRTYGMSYAGYGIRFRVREGEAEILEAIMNDE
ncbi:MAG: tRNA (N6-threonylcarbamoyladenosine(37)-N6)-methyltransferase TrmO [Clostridia bacterium]|nr:tRNA (N6-threonylcarbamoyladenosine(37)-N6)-methyltransferase TrmO [Clostridia bacterium]MBP5271320.1 tRNA (N6-threonylcarbamoyladenosine(37)-N6)-methyltransferase TrmO [Clostridia bacterium]